MKLKHQPQARLLCAAGPTCIASRRLQSLCSPAALGPTLCTSYLVMAVLPKRAGCYRLLELMLPASNPVKLMALRVRLHNEIDVRASFATWAPAACAPSTCFLTLLPLDTTQRHGLLLLLRTHLPRTAGAEHTGALARGLCRHALPACPFAGLSTAVPGGPSKLACVSRYFCTR